MKNIISLNLDFVGKEVCKNHNIKGVITAFDGKEIIDILALKNNISAVGLQKAADDSERCCFAASGRTEQCDKFFVVNIEINVI